MSTVVKLLEDRVLALALLALVVMQGFLAGCEVAPPGISTTQAESQEIHATSESPEPSQDPSPRATPTTVQEAEYRFSILLEYGQGDSAELWILDPPYVEPHPLAQGENSFYGMAVWSGDGDRLAYSKTEIGCPSPSSSVWVIRLDGTGLREVTDPIEGKINLNTGNCDLAIVYPASPQFWSNDSRFLAVDLLLEPYWVDLATGELTTLELASELSNIGLDGDEIGPQLMWSSKPAGGDHTLLTIGSEVEDQILVVLSLSGAEDMKVLNPPTEFSYDDFGYYGMSHSWSPDGRFLAIPERSDDTARLWIVDVVEDSWKVVNTIELSDDIGKPSVVKWSPDGNWLAWESWEFRSRIGIISRQLRLIETEAFSTVRTVSLKDDEIGNFRTWIADTQGNHRLVYTIEADDGGIFVIDPEDETKDELVVPYASLVIEGTDPSQIGPFQP